MWTAPAYYSSLMFVVVRVQSHSTLRFVVVKKIKNKIFFGHVQLVGVNTFVHVPTLTFVIVNIIGDILTAIRSYLFGHVN